jgi:hypothetical protein
MTMTRLSGSLIMLLCALSAEHPVGVGATRPTRPAALSKSADGDVFALDSAGSIFRLRVVNQQFTDVRSYPLPSFSSAIDCVSSQLGGKTSVFITARGQSVSYLYEYSREGYLQRTWTTFSPLSGLDVDSSAHILYVTRSDQAVIYQIDLSKKGELRGIGSVAGATRLGPIVLDANHGQLYLGDLVSGAIYQFDIHTRHSHVIATSHESVGALALSADASNLYIAAPDQRRVYSLELHTNGTIRTFSHIREFRSPTGLTILNNGSLLVADDVAGKIFLLSQDGELQATFPP